MVALSRGSFARYVSLNVLGMLGISVYILADTYFIAFVLQDLGIAALNFSIPVFLLLQATGLMLSVGASTRFTLLWHRGDRAGAASCVSQSFFWLMAFALLFVWLGFGGSALLAEVMGATGQALALAQVYIRTILLAAPAFLLHHYLSAFVRNDGRPALAMAGMLFSSGLNIYLDYLFMLRFEMGIFGAALATALAAVASVLLLATHLLTKRSRLRFGAFIPRLQRLWEFARLGVSAAMGELASALALVSFNWLMAIHRGNVGVAAYGIVANLALIATAILTGVAQGLQPLVSAAKGQNDEKSLRRLFYDSLLTAEALGLGILAFVWLRRSRLVSLFNQGGDPRLAALAEEGLLLYFLGFAFAGMNLVLAAYFSAVEAPQLGMLLSFLRGALLMLPVLWIAQAFWAVQGIWLSFVITEALVFFWAMKAKRSLALCYPRAKGD